MNRGGFQMMEGRSPSWWSVNNMRPPDPELTLPFLPSSSSSSSPPAFLPQPHISSDMNSWQEGQGLRESWCQLLLGASVEEEDRYGLSHPDFPIKKMESCVDQPGADRVLLYPPPAHIADVIKREYSGLSGYVHRNEEIQVSKSSWSLPGSSPRSCVTTSFSANMLDFTNKSRHHLPADNLSEGNSKETAPAFKKARVQGSSSPKSTLKVRKEKLGDRITALHQLVSPFGKTDTASVLQEAIGYIRFLQGQIQVLSTPYLQGSAPGSMRQQPAQEEEDEDEETKKNKDLRSRGLCLVPVSFTMHVNGGDNAAADLWAPAFSAGF